MRACTQAADMVQQRVLAHEGITVAARDFLATKLQTSNVPVRADRGRRFE